MGKKFLEVRIPEKSRIKRFSLIKDPDFKRFFLPDNSYFNLFIRCILIRMFDNIRACLIDSQNNIGNSFIRKTELPGSFRNECPDIFQLFRTA
jgi:hypothetical protein